MEKNNLRRLLLLVQVCIFFFLEKLLPQSLKYFSSYGTISDVTYYSLWLIPAILFASTFFREKYQSYFFFLFSLILLKNIYLVSAVILFFLIFFTGVRLKKKSKAYTSFWILVLSIITFSSIYYLNSVNALSWFWLLMHVSWALKLIAWTVTIRLYDEDYNLEQFLAFFFNPVFFFFTNDLNVLTPKRFFDSRVVTGEFDKNKFKKVLWQSLTGMFLLTLYGVMQKYYFQNLENLGFFGMAFIGSFISIFVAILFHGANSCIQVSMLNAFHYDLAVDMNRPWMASSPSDYWKRMHFYVRDYIFEIITKPILTTVIRWNVRMLHFRIFIIGIIYLIFTCTQVGYQPYRQGRTLVIGFLVTGVFVAMMAVPELILSKRAQSYMEKRAWLGRTMTFMILYVGYYFIFAVRKGF